MKILVLNYEYPPLGGGAGIACEAIAQALASRGHRVEVLTSGLEGLAADAEADGVRVVRLEVGRAERHRGTLLQMARYVRVASEAGARLSREGGFDSALAFFGMPSGEVARRIRHRTGLPYVVSLRGSDVPGHLSGGAAFRVLRGALGGRIERVWREAASVASVSDQLAELARARCPSLRPVVIPNGVTACATTRRDRRDGALRLAWIGRMAPAKGLDVLLRALASLPPDMPPWEAHLAGDGPLRARMETLARRLGLGSRVRFLGWLPHERIGAFLSESDLFALASLDEGMPGVVLEAFASGLPVVASRIRAMRDIVREGHNGLLADPGESAPLSRAIERLLRDGALRARLGATARRDAQSYRWEHAAESYERLLGAACGAARATAADGSPSDAPVGASLCG
ncbi:MAG: glycosyltransferase family 4 protein [Planctomycetes bacterium]|nr:glycosyltransferase family 4 protein [Planctomycetota bacterium]